MGMHKHRYCDTARLIMLLVDALHCFAIEQLAPCVSNLDLKLLLWRAIAMPINHTPVD